MDYNTENLLWMISEIMNEHGDYNTPIWATEAGFYLSTWTYLRIRYQWTMNAELFACTRMERVTHNFIDFSPEQNEALDAQAGLISGTVFDYREMVPYPITRDTTIVFAFLNPDTRHSYQVRTKEDPPPYFPFTLNINTPYAIKVDMYGDTTDIVVQGSPGNYYIEFDSLDANPIVVVEQFSDIFAGNIAEWDSDILTKLYPTPFNEMVKIEYCLPEAMMVKLEIFNTLGQKIASLENSNKIGGIYQTEWNGKDLRGNLCASGIYFISFTGDETISHNSYRETKKILLIR
jgi:hypothetical protein